MHDKIKDFKCDKCEYVCSSKGNLQKHVNIVHAKLKDFKCVKCDYVCSSNDTLKMHIKTVHAKIKDIKWKSFSSLVEKNKCTDSKCVINIKDIISFLLVKTI